MWKSSKVYPLSEISSSIGMVEKPRIDSSSLFASTGNRPIKENIRMRINEEGMFAATSSITDAILEELEKSREAAKALSKASEEALVNLTTKFEGATSASEREFFAKLNAEREIHLLERVALNNACDLLLLKQRLRYEDAAIASAEATELRFKMLRREAMLSLKRMSDEKDLRFAMERFAAMIQSEITSELLELELADQQAKCECVIKDANAAIMLSQASARAAEIRAEENALSILMSAKEEQSLTLKTMRVRYEKAARAASNASELSMGTLIFKSELANHYAQEKFDSRIQSERAESEAMAKSIVEANTTMLKKQQLKYETAAFAATEAHKSSIEILQEDSRTIIEAFNVEIEAKDLQYKEVKLSAERLEHQILTDRLAQAAASAQRENEVLLSVCSNVAHDLNSPLQTLIHGIESLRFERTQSLESMYSTDELLDSLDSACAFMRCAISRTIDLTEANNGIGLTPLITDFDLQSSLDAPLKWIQSMLPPDGRVTVELEPLPDGVNIISTDQRWLEENLLCLLSNGVKFSDQGVVRVTTTLDKGMIRITVEDNGVGIHVDARPKLFEQISQVQRLSVGGSGLGLYSLSKRSQAIGGSCGEDDRIDGQQGSSFWFELPYHAATNDAISTPVSPPSISTPTTLENVTPLNVLIVDDSIAVVKMLSIKLTSFGYNVTTAKNGLEGLEKMISACPELDLVIMDLQMPVMDGIEATRKYRENEREREIMQEKLNSLRLANSSSYIPIRRRRLPIICSSANSSGEAGLRAIEAGVDSFLPKPFNKDEFSTALRMAEMCNCSIDSLFSTSGEI